VGKYSSFKHEPEAKPRRDNPIWRGIGCLLMIVVPVISYAAAYLTLVALVPLGLVPYQLLVTPQVPDWLWYVPAVARFVQALVGQPALYAMLLFTFVYILLTGGVLSLLYAIVYQAFGPPRYGPLDAPAAGIKAKRYTR
jgi:hypothetical protein